jgi:hypothetical protein
MHLLCRIVSSGNPQHLSKDFKKREQLLVELIRPAKLNDRLIRAYYGSPLTLNVVRVWIAFIVE